MSLVSWESKGVYISNQMWKPKKIFNWLTYPVDFYVTLNQTWKQIKVVVRLRNSSA